MKNINTIIKKIEELGETSKTVSGVTKNLKAILSEITEEEKQVIMKKLTERRIKYTEKQKNNLTNINFFIANIKCKTKAEINEILKEHKQTRKQEKELKKNNPSPIKKLQTRIQKKKEKKASKKENVTPEIIPIKANEEIRQPKITLVVEPKEGNITEEGIAETISDTLNEEEKIQLKKTIRNKTPKEINHTLRANKNPMMGKIIKKIAISIGIVTITSGLIRAIWTRAQKDAKNKREYDTEQEVDQKKNDNTTKKEVIIPPPEEKFTTEKIQQSISPDKLQGVSYENIIAAVEKIPDPKVKRQVIDLLKAGDIVGLQQLYSMKTNSEYTSNKATGFLDKNTLNKIKNPLFGLAGQELIDNENIPQEVKEIYKEFVIGQISHDNLPYLILSKNTCKQYLFDKNNELIDIQTILIGANLGNKGKFMPYEYYKVEGGKKKYVRGEINRNTPTGLFKVKKTIDLSANYNVDGPKRGINIVPIDPQGNEEERFKYKQWGLAIHPMYQPPSNPEKYENAMASGSIQDNTITHGCPNIQNFGIIFDNLAIGSKVYICTE